MVSVLVVDDNRSTLKAMEAILRREGYKAFSAESGEAALRYLQDEDVDLVLSDVKMPGMTGLDLLRRVKAEDTGAVVVMMSGQREVNVAVEAIKEGAFDYLVKPLSKDDVLRVVQKALAMRALMVENLVLKRQVRDQFDQSNIIGSSPAWRHVRDMVQHVAPSRSTVLVTGESGTGKEVIAMMLHRLSARADQPFIPLNAAALPPTLLEAELFGHEKGAFTGAYERKPGHFELASGGTVFLDEIGDMPLEVQVKLLRVLQDGTFKRLGGIRDLKVDVRVITATNKNLAEEVRAKRFREDLYYRLNVITVQLPALRERPQDIPLLVSHFIQKYAKQNRKQVKSIQQEALQQLQAYHWPGNVRELENVIERAVVLTLGSTISTADLSLDDLHVAPPPQREDYLILPRQVTLAEIEREAIIRTLEYQRGNRQATSRQLAISPATLYRKLKEYQIV
jgi:DNA-binding NtrC family response regulator